MGYVKKNVWFIFTYVIQMFHKFTMKDPGNSQFSLQNFKISIL